MNSDFLEHDILNTQTEKKHRTVMAVASRGGHWTQMLRLSEAFADCDVIFVTTDRDYSSMIPRGEFHTILEADRTTKFRLLISLVQVFWLVLRKRPDVVISTGAAPGYFAIRFGKLFGAKTLWVDSIANAEQLSMSGRLVQTHADLVLTQWEHIAKENGPQHWGSVI